MNILNHIMSSGTLMTIGSKSATTAPMKVAAARRENLIFKERNALTETIKGGI